MTKIQCFCTIKNNIVACLSLFGAYHAWTDYPAVQEFLRSMAGLYHKAK